MRGPAHQTYKEEGLVSLFFLKKEIKTTQTSYRPTV